MVRVALVQLAVNETESVSTRIARALIMTEQAATRADMVLLPELWPTGAFDLKLGLQHARSMSNPLIGQLGEIAVRTNSWIHGGSFVEVDEAGSRYNTSILLTPAGTLAASYRKVHLFGFTTGEAAMLTAGDELVVVETPLGKTGLATCYDLRFPELFRALVDKGATAVFVPSGWPTTRIEHWTVLARARALENQMWIIGCNEVGLHGSIDLGGRSLVVDPSGSVLAQADRSEQIMYVEVNPDDAEVARADFPVLRDRRL